MPCYCRFQKCTICCNWSSNSWVLWVVESRWMARLCLHFSRLSSNKSLWRSPQCWNCLQGVGKNPRTDWPSFGYSGEAYRRGRSQMQIRWSPGLAFLTFFFFFSKEISLFILMGTCSLIVEGGTLHSLLFKKQERSWNGFLYNLVF